VQSSSFGGNEPLWVPHLPHTCIPVESPHSHTPCRATRTLITYLQETNLALCYWLVKFQSANPITLSGSWEVGEHACVRACVHTRMRAYACQMYCWHALWKSYRFAHVRLGC